jgi:glycosyltransferase involved in cell wall biosynthesis
MKVALCAPADLHALARFQGQDCACIAPGLGSTATTPLIVELLRRGHELTLYTLSKGLAQPEIYNWGMLRIVAGGFRDRHLASAYYRPEIGFLRKAIAADAPAFVHAHWTYEFALGALRSGIPTLTTIHDLPWNVLRYYRDPHRAVRLLMAYEVALRCRHFTAVSASAARHFVRYIKPGTTIDVIPNGLPDAIFAMGRDSRRESGQPITFAAVLQGWSRRKNPKAALQAFRIAKRQFPGARLVLYGCGYEANGCAHRWARETNLDRDVVFAGPLPHLELLRRIDAEVDIVVHPSRDEAFSMTALEMMALRKAIIAGDHTPGMREMFGGDGVLVDVRNPAAMAQAMVQLASDAESRHRLADCCFERAFKHFRLSMAAARYEALYRDMLYPRTAGAGVHDAAPQSTVSLDL